MTGLEQPGSRIVMRSLTNPNKKDCPCSGLMTANPSTANPSIRQLLLEQQPDSNRQDDSDSGWNAWSPSLEIDRDLAGMQDWSS